MGGTRGVPGLRKPEPRLEPREKSIRARRIAGTQDHRTQGLQNSGPPYQGSALTECGHRIYRSTSRTTDPRRTIQWSEDPPATYRRSAQDRARAELTPLFSLQENPRPSYFLAEKIDLRIPLESDIGNEDPRAHAGGMGKRVRALAADADAIRPTLGENRGAQPRRIPELSG